MVLHYPPRAEHEPTVGLVPAEAMIFHFEAANSGS
jgi:hypothetical protein